MPRTTVTACKEILSTTLTDSQIYAFILDANIFVTEELGAEDPALSASRLEVIERYLACALVRLRDLGIKNATLKDMSETYQVDSEVTDYLLRAASFDPTGAIRKHFLAPKEFSSTPQLKYRVGKTFTEEADEEDGDL